MHIHTFTHTDLVDSFAAVSRVSAAFSAVLWAVSGDWPARGVPVPGFPGRFLRYADAARQLAKTELCFVHAPVPDLSLGQAGTAMYPLIDLRLSCWM